MQIVWSEAEIYKTSTSASLHRCAAWVDIWGEISSSQGFRKVFCTELQSQVIILCLKCFKFKTFGLFQTSFVLHGKDYGCAIPMVALHSGDGATVPGVLLKVRLCSLFAAGSTFLEGVSLDYPPLLRLALPNTLHARISLVSSIFCTSS